MKVIVYVSPIFAQELCILFVPGFAVEALPHLVSAFSSFRTIQATFEAGTLILVGFRQTAMMYR